MSDKQLVFTRRNQDDQLITLTPDILAWNPGKVIYDKFHELKKTKYNNNPCLKLAIEHGKLAGSCLFSVSLIDEILREFGVRSPRPVDLGDQEIMKKVARRNQVYAAAVVLRSDKDGFNPRNNNLAARLTESIDLSKGPALITDFQLENWAEDNQGYGLRLAPINKKLTVIQDDRLLGKWNDYRFNDVDDQGLPLHLDKTEGKRRWSTRDDGLSCFYMGKGSGLVTNYSRLGRNMYSARLAVMQ